MMLAAAFAWVLTAQDWANLVQLDKFAPKAEETVEVNLDGNMLSMAARFLSDRKPQEAEAKKLLGNVKGIYVRSFKFAKAGEYAAGDVEQIRSQLRGPQWSRVVDVRSNKPGGDNAGVFFKTDGKEIQGIVVLAAEPKEFTVVSIVGNIQPEQLKDLSGKFGVPDLGEAIGGAQRNKALTDSHPKKKGAAKGKDE